MNVFSSSVKACGYGFYWNYKDSPYLKMGLIAIKAMVNDFIKHKYLFHIYLFTYFRDTKGTNVNSHFSKCPKNKHETNKFNLTLQKNTLKKFGTNLYNTYY
jgi:hypothetical protein